MRPRRSRSEGPPFPWALAVVFGPLVLVVVLAGVLSALVLPGGSALVAGDCLADGICTVSMAYRGGPVVTGHHRGGSAYLQGTLFVLLAGLTSYMTMKTLAGIVRVVRDVRPAEPPDSAALL